MSRKINIRSPFYLDFSEPAEPTVELTCDLINLRDMTIDQFGNINLPTLTYGDIVSYTSTDVDFADGKFDTVLTDTSRTVTFTIGIPPNFSNAADDTIDCDITATQPKFVCTGGVTNNGTIPNQSIDTDGDSVTIDLTSYFTAGTDPITGYKIINTYRDYFETSLSGDDLTIIGTSKAGTHIFYVEATDGNPLTCDAIQSIQVTTTATVAYTADDAYTSGGSIAQDGTITNPTVNGTITAIKETSGGTPITSVAANNTGSPLSVTLYFDVTVPAGYSNSGATIEISKTFIQPTSVLPTFDCEVAKLTGQAISLAGNISAGYTNEGTISGFTPVSFPVVGTNTTRTVTFSITPPASGYSNSGGSDITCDVTMTQPAPTAVAGNERWLMTEQVRAYMLVSQAQADYPSSTSTFWNQISVEGLFDIYGLYSVSVLGSPYQNDMVLQSTDPIQNLYSYVYTYYASGSRIYRPPRAGYYAIKRGQYTERQTSTPYNEGTTYFIRIETNGFISEVWFVDWINDTFTKIDS